MRLFKIFLASPCDTENERLAAEEVVDEINKSIGSRDNFRLELLKWENDTYPAMGEDGQDVINKQIGSDYQIFVGIMWKKFGSPTKRASSGTEEEFQLAYERYTSKRNIQIMFYFNSAPIPQAADLMQAQKVKDFKKKIEELGAYHKQFSLTKDFEKTLRMDLIRYIKDILIEENNAIETTSAITKGQRQVIPEIKENFKEFLNDIEARFAHSKVDNLCLENIYIAPDLKELNSDKKSATTKVENLDELTDTIGAKGTKFVLIGNDSIGKSASCKYLFQKYFELGFYPILINGIDVGANIRPETLQKLIEKKITEQYEISFQISEVDNTRIVVIIDDFHKTTKGKSKYWPALMNNLESIFTHIIITGNTTMPIDNLNKQDPFKNFKLYTILEFGPKFRYDLVNKWNTIGIDIRFEDHNEILRKNDAYIALIKSIIGKNYIPSYPFYLLSILQVLESGNVQNPNYSIHGFYYEVLINECFSKTIKDRKDISLYYNYLTQFCFFLFEQGVKDVSLEEFDAFHKKYCENHDLSYRKEVILETFDSAKLLYVNNRVYVKEKYVYYFFVAKYIANEIANKQEIKELVTKMCLRVFRDEYASIIMFVTHLSKDNFIITKLIEIAESLFPEAKVTQLQDDIKGINEFVEKIPQQVLEIVNVNEQRDEELREEEEREKLEKELEKEKGDYDNFSLDDDISTIDFFAQITRALKTIDILGQVVKKHWGELNGEQKLNLVTTTYNVGLKTLDSYLQLLQRNSKDIVEHISRLIKEKHFKDKHSLKIRAEEESRGFIFRLCFMVSFGITKRISNAIGYDKLKNSFSKALEAQPYNSVKLIDLAVKLSYSNIATNIELIENYNDEMEKNRLSMLVLQNLVIDHMYMFETDYRTKDKICTTLGISVQKQLIIDQTSTIKRDVK
ncbi:MAG: DUF4062 domain-containing protein [Fibromonadaceae bacterium]|jgi:hypothetical protein|nr:DUF4062 domain-containing protein [Fibromonadaceae bacterium]